MRYMLGIVLGALLFAAAVWYAVRIGLPRVLQILGSKDRHWFEYRLRPSEGEFNIFSEGSPRGPFACLLESIAEADYNETADTFEKTQVSDKERARQSGNYFAQHGLGYVGPNKFFFERRIEYYAWKDNLIPGANPGDPPRGGLVLKVRGVYDEDGKPPSYYRRYYMAVWAQNLEIDSDAPIDLIWQLTVEVVHPQRAIYREGGFVHKVEALVFETSRTGVQGKKFEVVKSEQTRKEETSLASQVMGLSGETRGQDGTVQEIEGGLLELVGVRIADARLVQVDYSGSPEMERVRELVEIATKKLEVAKLEAEGIREKVAAYGSHPVGGAVAARDAVVEGKPTTLIMGGGVAPTFDVTNATPAAPEKKPQSEAEGGEKK